MKNLIKIAITFAFIAASTGQLPRIIKEVRIAQLKLLKESQASKWPKALLLPSCSSLYQGK